MLYLTVLYHVVSSSWLVASNTRARGEQSKVGSSRVEGRKQIQTRKEGKLAKMGGEGRSWSLFLRTTNGLNSSSTWTWTPRKFNSLTVRFCSLQVWYSFVFASLNQARARAPPPPSLTRGAGDPRGCVVLGPVDPCHRCSRLLSPRMYPGGTKMI